MTHSATAHVLEELALYGRRAFCDEPDRRPLPDADTLRSGLGDVFDVMTGILADTRLEDDAEGILWGLVNVFHRKIARVAKALDTNEDAQRRSQREQDGSEVRSVELERLIEEGLALIEQRDAFELMRDFGAELFESHTGSAWRPFSGSMVNHGTTTAAMIDSRDYIRARKRAEVETLIPKGTLIAFTGGTDYQDHKAVWRALDRVRERYPDMVLAHGGATKGAELIASKWASQRRVAQVPFRPDWGRFERAAPFKRNDQMLAQMPAAVIAFPGGGISANLAQKARQMGIPVYEPCKGTPSA